MHLFNWRDVDDYGVSAPSRNTNIQKMWMRSTIGWSLECEAKLPRENAYNMLKMELETLGFVNNFWLIGICIILLAVIPHVAYLQMTTAERKKSWFLKLEPIVSRLIFIVIFDLLSSMS